MAQGSVRRYERTIAQGNAQVHQGDRIHSNIYRIEYVKNLQILIEGQQYHHLLGDRSTSGLLFDKTGPCENRNGSSITTSHTLEQTTTANETSQIHHGVHKRGANVSALLGVTSPNAEGSHSSWTQRLPQNDMPDQVQSTSRGINLIHHESLPIVIDSLRRSTCLPIILDFVQRLGGVLCSNQRLDFPSASGLAERSVELPSSGYMIQDLFATCGALITFMILDSTPNTGKGTSAVSRQPQKISLLAGLLAYAVLRYICFPVVRCALSELSGDHIILQDPFCIERKVPLSHCSHIKLLAAYLNVNLAGTPVEHFIEMKQFHFALGGRGGRLIEDEAWSKGGVIKSGMKVVMSIYLKRLTTKCLACASDLILSSDGQYTCHPCGRSFGNRAALKLRATSSDSRPEASSVTAKGLKQKRIKLRDSENKSTPPKQIKEQEKDEEEDIAFNVEAIRNIDFEILRTRQSSRHTTSGAAFCSFCDNQPSGFRGFDLLIAHIQTCHREARRGWVCRATEPSHRSDAGCEACSSFRMYDTGYAAALHLESDHFPELSPFVVSNRMEYQFESGMIGKEIRHWISEVYVMESSRGSVVQALTHRPQVIYRRVDRIVFVRAIYDFESNEFNQLSFRKGAKIRVLSQLSNGWWDGLLDGTRSWFPSNYCCKIDPDDTDDESSELSDIEEEHEEEEDPDENSTDLTASQNGMNGEHDLDAQSLQADDIRLPLFIMSDFRRGVKGKWKGVSKTRA